MGTYATVTAVLATFPSFPQTTTTARYTETTQLISTTIGDAEAHVNAMIANRYSVPFAAGAVPPEIVKITKNLAAYYAFRSKFTRDSHNTNDWVLQIGEEMMKELEMIRDREMDIVDTAGSLLTESTAQTRIISSTKDFAPWANVDSITSWVVDPDRLDEVKSER